MTARIITTTHEVLISRATMFEIGSNRQVINFARSLLPAGLQPISNGLPEAVDHDTYRIVFRVAKYVEEPAVKIEVHNPATDPSKTWANSPHFKTGVA